MLFFFKKDPTSPPGTHLKNMENALSTIQVPSELSFSALYEKIIVYYAEEPVYRKESDIFNDMDVLVNYAKTQNIHTLMAAYPETMGASILWFLACAASVNHLSARKFLYSCIEEATLDSLYVSPKIGGLQRVSVLWFLGKASMEDGFYYPFDHVWVKYSYRFEPAVLQYVFPYTQESLLFFVFKKSSNRLFFWREKMLELLACTPEVFNRADLHYIEKVENRQVSSSTPWWYDPEPRAWFEKMNIIINDRIHFFEYRASKKNSIIDHMEQIHFRSYAYTAMRSGYLSAFIVLAEFLEQKGLYKAALEAYASIPVTSKLTVMLEERIAYYSMALSKQDLSLAQREYYTAAKDRVEKKLYVCCPSVQNHQPVWPLEIEGKSSVSAQEESTVVPPFIFQVEDKKGMAVVSDKRRKLLQSNEEKKTGVERSSSLSELNPLRTYKP